MKMEKNKQIQLSKRLAYILRHSNLPDRNGWVENNTIMYELVISQQELEQIVMNDNKGRFELHEDKVRALYGHSIDVDLNLTPSIPPPELYHGTAEKYIENIYTKEQGLRPQKRKYVHLSETIEMAKEVGSRHGQPIVLAIDTELMIEDGYKFYRMPNGIWLTDCVPFLYIK